MGVHQLLRELRGFCKVVDVDSLKHRVIGVDGNALLYKLAVGAGILSSTSQLFSDSRQQFRNLLWGWIERLRAIGVEDLLFVFDGCPINMKSAEQKRRQQSKQQSYALAVQAEQEGDETTAVRLFRRTVCVDFALIQVVLSLLREWQVAYLVAPYEADAQLAYLSQQQAVDIVISEDSDLLAYGCKKVLYKYDGRAKGQLLCLSDLFTRTDSKFFGWDQRRFIIFCCLCGCDYLANIPSVGIKTAYQIVRSHDSLESVSRHLSTEYAAYCTGEYLDQLRRALLTYLHHIVYNVEKRVTEVLHSDLLMPQSEALVAQTIGPHIGNHVLHQLVKGEIAPYDAMEKMSCKIRGNMKRKELSDNSSEQRQREEDFVEEVASSHYGRAIGRGANPADSSICWVAPDDQQLHELPVPATAANAARSKDRKKRAKLLSKAEAILQHYGQFASPNLSRKFRRFFPVNPSVVNTTSSAQEQTHGAIEGVKLTNGRESVVGDEEFALPSAEDNQNSSRPLHNLSVSNQSVNTNTFFDDDVCCRRSCGWSVAGEKPSRISSVEAAAGDGAVVSATDVHAHHELNELEALRLRHIRQLCPALQLR